MNIKVLKEAERAFLKRYPEGFMHPEMVSLGKKHKMDQLTDFAQQSFAKDRFDHPSIVLSDMAKLVSRSTMVSMFEKPKFKAAVSDLATRDKAKLAAGLYELLHGKEKAGFDSLLDELKKLKLAKWTIATVCQAYYRPNKDVFIKPTTAKLIVDCLDIDLEYHSTPSWAFYRDFRKCIKEIKAKVEKSLAPNNAAFLRFSDDYARK